MDIWRRVGLVLSIVGLADAVYLLSDSLFPKFVKVVCPSSGIIDCGAVTSSPFSRIDHIPVALLGTLFFVSMIAIILIDKPSFYLLMIPIWISGVAFACYLIIAELFFIHAICPYCTLAHVLAISIGLPVFKLALGSE
ncbi:MAG TPA: vitamin K epoxide reductase family protein [Nitrososphaerales archaeon]|nr:vitamin K epoxide reductase family protein [Nitrososphaerales archaeon]